MLNVHSGKATAQVLEEGALLQEYGGTDKTEGFGGRKLVRGYGVKFDCK